MPDVALDEPQVETGDDFVASLAKDMAAARAESDAQAKVAAPAPEARSLTQEPPKAPAPAPATKPEDADAEIESGKRAPRADDWKRLKSTHQKEKEEISGKLKSYEGELSELKKAPKHNAKLIEELTSERDRYKALHDTVLVEWSPDFNAKFQSRVDAVLTPLKASLGDKGAKIAEALLMPNDNEYKRRALVELMTDVDEFTRSEIAVANRDLRVIMSERAAEVAKGPEALRGIVDQKLAEQKARGESSAKAFESVLEKSREMAVFQTREEKAETDKAWNAEVKERAEVARAIYDGRLSSDEERAEKALWAASTPAFLRQLSAQASEIETLKGTIQKLQSASPSLRGSGAAAPPPEGNFAETFSQHVRAAQAAK